MNASIWLLSRLGVALPLAILLGAGVYLYALPELIWSEYQAEMPHHQLAPPNVSHGAGSTDLHYETMTYDCSEGDVVLEGVAPDAPYWQIGIYDRWVRALDGGHLNHRTIQTDADGHFEVRVTRTPGGRPNTLDCSREHRGMLMFRVVLPRAPVVAPTVRVER